MTADSLGVILSRDTNTPTHTLTVGECIRGRVTYNICPVSRYHYTFCVSEVILNFLRPVGGHKTPNCRKFNLTASSIFVILSGRLNYSTCYCTFSSCIDFSWCLLTVTLLGRWVDAFGFNHP